MKSLLTILLSLVVSFQSVGIGISDLLMLTDLVEHAKFHAEEHGDDFFTFFDKHYGSLKAEHQKVNKEEEAQHEKLPFQHQNCNHNLSEVVVVVYEFSLNKTEGFAIEKLNFHYQNLYTFLERASIFQPPKIA